jgi:undecaprenyl-diphosphatase
MLNTLIIIGAKYLYIASIVVAIIYVLREPRKEQKRILILTIVSLPLVYLVAKIGSLIYFDPRPFVVGNFTPLVSHVADNGFPSDHTLLTSAIASVIYMSSRKTGIVLWIVALLVGLSRIAAGIHHPIDILGSIIISLIVIYLVNKLLIQRILGRTNLD